MRKVLFEALPGAVAPEEFAVARFLVDGVALPIADTPTVVLQTTFANVYPDCYARLPGSVPLVLMARNPYSVCRSLVYNWNSLSIELAHRQGHPGKDVVFANDRARWEAAIAIYVQSMRAGLEIISDRPERTRLVVYDQFVHQVGAGLAQLSGLLKRPLQSDIVNARADPSTTIKQASLPPDFRRLVTERCLGAFEKLVERAQTLGNRLELQRRTT
jgi:hypothetical protein